MVCQWGWLSGDRAQGLTQPATADCPPKRACACHPGHLLPAAAAHTAQARLATVTWQPTVPAAAAGLSVRLGERAPLRGTRTRGAWAAGLSVRRGRPLRAAAGLKPERESGPQPERESEP